LPQQHRIAYGKLRLHVGGYARRKLNGSDRVQRNSQHAAQHASVEGRDPLGAVLCPQQHPIARPNFALGQERRKPPGQPRKLRVSGYPPTVSLIAHHGDLAIEAAEVVEECSQMGSHGRSGKDDGTRCGCFIIFMDVK